MAIYKETPAFNTERRASHIIELRNAVKAEYARRGGSAAFVDDAELGSGIWVTAKFSHLTAVRDRISAIRNYTYTDSSWMANSKSQHILELRSIIATMESHPMVGSVS